VPKITEPEVVIENLSYIYPKAEKPAIKNINLTIKKGEFVTIMGPTGAGKTTLCYAIVGLVPQFFEGGIMKGNVIVKGMSTRKYPIQKICTVAGIVFQDFENQIFGITVEDDVSYGPIFLGFDFEEVKKRVKKALSLVRLNGYEKRTVYTLSGGETQRLAIADILAMEPEIIVLDEPTSQLDPVGKEEVFQTLEDLRKKTDATIVLVEHKSEEVAKFSDRIIVMNDGEIVLEGPPRKIFENVDELLNIGVRPPQVCELFSSLRKKGMEFESFPITLEEAVDVLSKNLASLAKRKTVETRKHTSSSEMTEKVGSGEPIIEVRDLWHIYPGGVEALKGVGFNIYKGEFVAIIGPNGSGKSTLLKHFNGLLKPTKGEVIVDGLNVKDTTTGKLARKVGLVFQNPDHQLFAKSVKEEIEYGLKNIGLPEDEIEQRIKDAIEFTGLKGYEEKHPLLLKKDERQRVAFASIIAMAPEIIVVDEPTTGQDFKGSERMMQMLTKLNNLGKTIIVVTHDLRLVAEYANRVIALFQGKIIVDGSTREVFVNYFDALREAYLSPPQIIHLARMLAKYGVRQDILRVEEMVEEIIKLRGGK